MGISCCTSRDTHPDALMEKVRHEMEQTYSARLEMKPIVNLISETSKLNRNMKHMKSIKAHGNASQYSSESEAEKLDLKVELLL